jgi:hypothetical protein
VRQYWLPYIPTSYAFDSWARESFDRRNRHNVYRWADWNHSLDQAFIFDTREDAMKDLDRRLVERGDYLIPEDRVDAFKEKLLVLL